MVQGEISEADTPTILLGTTLTGLISDPLQSHPPSLRWMPFLPIYRGLGQALNMLACIPSGLVFLLQNQLKTDQETG